MLGWLQNLGMAGGTGPVYVVGGNGSTCVLMLHMDADDDWTTIVDDSAGGLPKIITAYETARIVNAESRFGVGSLYCDAGGAFVKVTQSSDFFFQAGDITIDFWAKVLDPVRSYLFAWYLDDDNFFALERVNTRGAFVQFQLRLRVAGVDQVTVVSSTDEHFDVTEWQHYVVARRTAQPGDVGIIDLIVGGTPVGSAPISGSGSVNLQAWPLYVGASLDLGRAGLQTLDGYIDEFRVLRGETAWPGEEFTPYSNPYSARHTAGGGGEHHVYGSFVSGGGGEHGVALRRFTAGGGGTHHVLGSFVSGGGGEHHVYGSFVSGGGGEHNVAIRRFTSGGGGTHRVYARWTAGGGGMFSIASGRYTSGGGGLHHVRQRFTSGGGGTANNLTRFRSGGGGLHHVEDTALQRYELYENLGSAPDLTASPWETWDWNGEDSSDMDHQTAAMTGEGIHYLVLRRRNRWNLVDGNLRTWEIELNGDDEQILTKPRDPSNVEVVPAANGAVRVTADYRYDEDRDPALAADTWALFITTDGTDPDPDVDVPTLVTMGKADSIAKLDWTSPEYGDELTVKVIVRTYRGGSQRDQDQRESPSLSIAQATSSTSGPAQPVLEYT